jgi:phosphatidate phosphatase APP1
MEGKLPILLSFYAIAGEKSGLVFGQLTYTRIKDLTFQSYSRLRTFRTLFRLYRTKPFAGQEIVLTLSSGEVRATTDAHGSFTAHTNIELVNAPLQKVALSSGQEVKLIDGLYPKTTVEVRSDTIVISDVDDTILHSFISNKGKKFRTLMFTRMEKRRAVVAIQSLLNQFSEQGSAIFYLSNSEQNLHPLIYRFLDHNKFPRGPLFLKKLRRLWHVIRNIRFPLRHLHKEETIADIQALFPSKKLILIGDNTQQDLLIYLEAAKKFPDSISTIIVLKVVANAGDADLIENHRETLTRSNIRLIYSEKVPEHIHV